MVAVALIGYGEVGRILAEDLRAAGHTVSAFDLRLVGASGAEGQDAVRDRMRLHAESHGVRLGVDHVDAVGGAEVVVCAVTADQTVAAAEAAAPGLAAGRVFLDLNSASPGAKGRAAAHVASVGGRYVEGAVMTSVPPWRIRVPLLIGGPHAADAVATLSQLGFVPEVASERLGVASATKMCRSIIIKGMEAMFVESLIAARHLGVEQSVLASLGETFPGIDWQRQASYFFQRVIAHGRRRAEEMREAAATVREAGLQPSSAVATSERQAWMAALAERGVFGPPDAPDFARSHDWRTEADRVLAVIASGEAR